MSKGVRLAKEGDLVLIKTIADENRYALGFITRSIIREWIYNRSILVYEYKGKIVGFVSFHHRRDKWTTIYDICIEKKFRRRGFGRILLAAVEKESLDHGQIGIRLKCPVDLSANTFYAKCGFTRIGIEQGRRRLLVIWIKHISSMLKEKTFSPSFFITLTSYAKGIKDIINAWDASGDKRNPFKHIILAPLFSSEATINLIQKIKAERGSIVMFDSGGYQVQMGKICYKELVNRLQSFYREHTWADWYVLPDYVPHSSDDDIDVELKVQETLNSAKLFLQKMPDNFVYKVVGVVHGRTEKQVRRCVEAYNAMGINYLGFGSFGNSGPKRMINHISRYSLDLLQFLQILVLKYGLYFHIFGIGSPHYLARLVHANISPTSFDSSGWWKAGAFGNIFFPSGKQLHITSMPKDKSTILLLERERQFSDHYCIFCSNLEVLWSDRMKRIMHNLSAMMDTIEQIERLKKRFHPLIPVFGKQFKSNN